MFSEFANCGLPIANYFFSSSFSIPLEASLNSRMPLPRPLANSGIRFAPNKRRTTNTRRKISPPPRLRKPSNIWLRIMFKIFSKCTALSDMKKEAHRLNGGLIYVENKMILFECICRFHNRYFFHVERIILHEFVFFKNLFRQS